MKAITVREVPMVDLAYKYAMLNDDGITYTHFAVPVQMSLSTSRSAKELLKDFLEEKYKEPIELNILEAPELLRNHSTQVSDAPELHKGHSLQMVKVPQKDIVNRFLSKKAQKDLNTIVSPDMIYQYTSFWPLGSLKNEKNNFDRSHEPLTDSTKLLGRILISVHGLYTAALHPLRLVYNYINNLIYMRNNQANIWLEDYEFKLDEDRPQKQSIFDTSLSTIREVLYKTLNFNIIPLDGLREAIKGSSISISFREEDFDLALKAFMNDINYLSSAGILRGHVVSPTIVKLANLSGNGKSAYAIFAVVLLKAGWVATPGNKIGFFLNPMDKEPAKTLKLYSGTTEGSSQSYRLTENHPYESLISETIRIRSDNEEEVTFTDQDNSAGEAFLRNALNAGHNNDKIE